MKIIFNFIRDRDIKKQRIIVWAVLVTAVMVSAPFIVMAGVDDFVTDVIAWLGLLLTSFFGTILLAFIDILIKIASYNNFIDSEAVTIGWVIVRDIANMFFVIVLLIITFATIFKIQTYQYQKMLVKFILAVIWVNFSKFITGLFIDLGQVVMMTFVNAFRDVAAGNFTYGFGLEDIVKLRQAGGNGLWGSRGTGGVGDIDNWDVLGSIVLGLIFLIIASAVILVMIVFLVTRIIYLWILAIFSPLVFILPMVPGGQKYTGKWWGELSKNIVLGPILAFFLWLTFSITSQAGDSERRAVIALDSGKTTTEIEDKWFASEISGTQNMFNFLVMIALLVMGLGFAQEVGGLTGKFAGATMGNLQKYGMKALKGTAGFIASRPTRMANHALRGGRGFGWTGVQNTLAGKWAGDIYASREKSKNAKRLALMKKVGLGDSAIEHIADKGDSYWKTKQRTGLGHLVTPAEFLVKKTFGNAIMRRTVKAADGEAKDLKAAKQSIAAMNGTDASARSREVRNYKTGDFMGPGRKLRPMAGRVLGAGGMNMAALQEFSKQINTDMAAAGTDQNKIDAVANRRDAMFDAITAVYKKDGNKYKNTDLEAWVNSGGKDSSGVDISMQDSSASSISDHVSGALDKVNFMRDIDTDRQARTDDAKQQFELDTKKAQGAGKSVETTNFFESQKYKQGLESGDFYSKEEFTENEGMSRHNRLRAEGGQALGGMSVNSFARDKANHVSVDFNQLGIEELEGKAGANFSDMDDDTRQQVASKMSGFVAERLSELKGKQDKTAGDEKQIDYLQKALQKFSNPENLKNLTLYNTAREGVGAKRLITHEMKHESIDEIDGNGRIQQDLWDNEHSDEQREKIRKQVRTKMNAPEMGDKEVMKEYFAEGMTNTTRWGDKSGSAIKLEDGILEKFEQRLKGAAQAGGMTRATNPSVGSDAKVELPSDFKLSGDIIQQIQADTKINTTVNHLSKLTQNPGFLSTNNLGPIMKSIKNLNMGMQGLSKKSNISFGLLGKKIGGLAGSIPESNNPIVIKAALEEHGISEDDVKSIVNGMK